MSPAQPKLVIVGAGMAGSKLASTLIDDDDINYHVTLIGEEAQAGYNRIMLSSLLANEIALNDMAMVNLDSMQAAGLTLITGDAVMNICTDSKSLTLMSGKKVNYDKLVFATGSRASHLPNIDCNASNVMSFRNLNDISKMELLSASSNVSVIGGGLLGLEAAVGLVKRGHQVTLIHRANHILNRQLDSAAASMLESTLSAMGITFRLGSAPIEFLVSKQDQLNQAKTITAIKLASAEEIPVEHIIIATGITPEISLAKQAGLVVNKAIKVNALMETSNEHIYALGECSEFQGETFGLVAPIWQQLDSLITGIKFSLQQVSKESINYFQIQPIPTKLKVSGINLFSVGEIHTEDESTCITLIDEKEQSYRKLIVENGFLKGAILYGDVADGAWYFDLIQKRICIMEQLDQVIFGEAYCSLNNDIGNVA